MKKWFKEGSFYLRYIYWESRCILTQSLLKICFSKKKMNKAFHINCLEEKIKKQAKQITDMQREAENKNKQMKAMNLLVACDGNCNRHYMENPEEVTEKIVWHCERISRRLRNWWERKKKIEEHLKEINKDLDEELKNEMQ